MIAATSRAAAIPFFRFGGAGASAAEPLGIVSGGLILDSGEADPTFVYRCQDRYLTYTGLAGMRTVFFVADDAHARRYRTLVERHAERYDLVAKWTGALPLDAIREPLYVACDIASMTAGACETFERQARALRDGPPVELRFNQISPTTARLAAQLDDLLAARGVPTAFDRGACHAAGALALFFHDKAHAAALALRAGPDSLPRHAETAFLAPGELLRIESWDALVARYAELSGDARPPAALYVKSSRDSGGNVAARLDAATFGERIGALRDAVAHDVLCEAADSPERIALVRAEIALAPSLRNRAYDDAALAAHARARRSRRAGITMLVQREIAPPRYGGGFAGLGLSYAIEAPDRIVPVAVAAQTYKDAQHQHFLGSLLDDELARTLPDDFAPAMEALCARFADVGYRGPINFDARLDADGRYVLIHDCNPRLSAVFPALAVRAAMQDAGMPARRVLSLGYRGELVCADLAAFLAALDVRALLYTAERPHGVVVLPNLARDGGLDALLVDVDDADVPRILAVLRENAGDASAAAERVYA